MLPVTVAMIVILSPDKPPPPLPLEGDEVEVEVDDGNPGEPMLPGVATIYIQYANPSAGERCIIPPAVLLPRSVVVELGLVFSTAPTSTPH